MSILPAVLQCCVGGRLRQTSPNRYPTPEYGPSQRTTNARLQQWGFDSNLALEVAETRKRGSTSAPTPQTRSCLGTAQRRPGHVDRQGGASPGSQAPNQAAYQQTMLPKVPAAQVLSDAEGLLCVTAAHWPLFDLQPYGSAARRFCGSLSGFETEAFGAGKTITAPE